VAQPQKGLIVQPSAQCLALIRSSETLALIAYHGPLDPPGLWTIGYGHTAGVQQGDTCTEEQAETWLAQDAQIACNAVLRLVDVPLTQGQLDALVDFTFNEGEGRLRSSTLLTLLNQHQYPAAGQQLLRWDFADGHPAAGLADRRKAELVLWNGPA
jgi:lysozyme